MSGAARRGKSAGVMLIRRNTSSCCEAFPGFFCRTGSKQILASTFFPIPALDEVVGQAHDGLGRCKGALRYLGRALRTQCNSHVDSWNR